RVVLPGRLERRALLQPLIDWVVPRGAFRRSPSLPHLQDHCQQQDQQASSTAAFQRWCAIRSLAAWSGGSPGSESRQVVKGCHPTGN
ncbi:hypothetical protein, partial [Thermogemmatispora sp.]|uniref:hypothetical protein n=1 Tax=Thermogemmatispora sp. TaxID=1968838 RepID=UPI00257D2493